MNNPLISVIVPVYNAKKYLNECISSIVNQTLKNIEIILVDDGSTDSSIKIMEKYAQNDSRIKIITQKQQYAGVARNKGIELACGEYIFFLDSDDYMELNTLEKLYNKAELEKADITACFVYNKEISNGKISKNDWSFNIKLLNGKTTFNYKDVPESIFQIFIGWCWDKLYRTDFIKNNDLKFKTFRSYEGAVFTHMALAQAKKITYIEDYLIYHTVHHDSLDYNREPYNPFISYIEIKDKLINKGLYELLEQSFINSLVQHICTHFTNERKLINKMKIYFYIRYKFFKIFNLDNYNLGYFYNENYIERLIKAKNSFIYMFPYIDKIMKSAFWIFKVWV